MRRILLKDLQAAVDRINRYTNSPATYSDSKPGEKFRANIGHYHLDLAYGGSKLVRTMNEGGGITEITHGFNSKRETYALMHAFLRGIETKGE